jgi:hypothetical protein
MIIEEHLVPRHGDVIANHPDENGIPNEPIPIVTAWTA